MPSTSSPNSKPPLPGDRRDTWLRAADAELLAACRVDVFRGSGRGGQKRNRTESAVRVTHLPTGIAVVCDDTRSQHTNKRLALRKLRETIALEVRRPPEPGAVNPRPARKSPDYPLWTAAVLDVLEAMEYRIGAAAAALGLSTSRLARTLADDPALWQAVNRERARRGLAPLRRPG